MTIKSLITIFFFLGFTSVEALANDYDVEGYGDSGYAYGEIESSSGSKDVEGYLYLEDGTEVYFDGEWSGNGEIEGYDEEGNYYELEVD